MFVVVRPDSLGIGPELLHLLDGLSLGIKARLSRVYHKLLKLLWRGLALESLHRADVLEYGGTVVLCLWPDRALAAGEQASSRSLLGLLRVQSDLHLKQRLLRRRFIHFVFILNL